MVERQVEGYGFARRYVNGSGTLTLKIAADCLHYVFSRRDIAERITTIGLGDDHEGEATVGIL